MQRGLGPKRWQRLHRFLHRAEPGPLAYALSGLTQRLIQHRTERPRPSPPEVPTVLVGCLGFGGAGKSVVVEWLVRRALARGVRVGVVGHGFGARSGGVAEIHSASDPQADDESAALKRRHPQARIWVGPRGLAATDARRCSDWVVIDGGFQDPTVAITASIVVIDATASRAVVPAGPLKESLAGLARADRVWLHKVDEPGRALPQADIRSRVRIREIELPNGRLVAAEWLKDRQVRPLVGIARPQSFRHTLEAAGARLVPGITVADHGRFPAIKSAGPIWVTTSKDRERLPAGLAAVVHVEAEVVDGLPRALELLP